MVKISKMLLLQVIFFILSFGEAIINFIFMAKTLTEVTKIICKYALILEKILSVRPTQVP